MTPGFDSDPLIVVIASAARQSGTTLRLPRALTKTIKFMAGLFEPGGDALA